MAKDVYFTANASDYTQLEGLYITEKDPPGFVTGVSLNAVGIIGVTTRGPTTVTQVDSAARFVEIFGGRDYGSGGTLINKIWKDIINKPFGTMYIKRVAASDAVAGAKAFAAASATAAITVTATSVGQWSTSANGGPKITIANATNGDSDYFNLTVSYQGSATTYENIVTTSTATDDDVAAIIGDDDGTLISVTITNNVRPANAASTALSSGSDGTLASADFTSALTAIANTEGPKIIFCADVATSQANLNAQIVTDAATVSDKIFVTWAGVHGQTPAAEASTVGTQITTRSDRIVWCYNSPYTIDPTTGTQIQVSPAPWMAAILSQTDVDTHPGSADNVTHTAGIRKLTNTSLSRANLITLRDAGICAFEKLPEGFVFRSGVTTNLTSGLTEITRRRMTDYIQLSLANRLRYYVKRKNTTANRAAVRADIENFLTSLAIRDRIVDTLSDGSPAFAIDQDGVNNANTRAQGIENVFLQVKLINHILSLALLTEIGTTVSITEQ